MFSFCLMWIKYNCTQGSWKCTACKRNPTVHQIACSKSFQIFSWDLNLTSPWALFLFLAFWLHTPFCMASFCLAALSVFSTEPLLVLYHSSLEMILVMLLQTQVLSLKLWTTDTAPWLLLIPSISVSLFPHTAHFNVTDCGNAAVWNASKCYSGYVEPFQVKTELQPMLHYIFLFNKSTVMTSDKSLCVYNSNLAWSVELETKTAGWIHSHFTG